eukprot:TRINITY_DN3614_c0_g1_i1.p1 TRINITY_DN3614_c0_g1~~TRINITY_DN3614_c0_g1_i1.p1  ORF type:complete len:449 (+),score=173.76 TRINITY_DN3614_c0_g1_i1:74-1420(+)
MSEIDPPSEVSSSSEPDPTSSDSEDPQSRPRTTGQLHRTGSSHTTPVSRPPRRRRCALSSSMPRAPTPASPPGRVPCSPGERVRQLKERLEQDLAKAVAGEQLGVEVEDAAVAFTPSPFSGPSNPSPAAAHPREPSEPAPCRVEAERREWAEEKRELEGRCEGMEEALRQADGRMRQLVSLLEAARAEIRRGRASEARLLAENSALRARCGTPTQRDTASQGGSSRAATPVVPDRGRGGYAAAHRSAVLRQSSPAPSEPSAHGSEPLRLSPARVLPSAIVRSRSRSGTPPRPPPPEQVSPARPLLPPPPEQVSPARPLLPSNIRKDRVQPEAVQSPPKQQPQPQRRDERALLMRRMQRALLPLPSRQEVAEEVDALVRQLRRHWRQQGRDLPLVRCGDSAYRLESTRDRPKLNLCVIDGRLVVRQGAGHRPLVELLEAKAPWGRVAMP